MKGKDNFEDVFTTNEEIELQRLEAELGSMFTDITSAPIREGFESELRSKIIEAQEPHLVAEEGKKKSFFLSSTLAGIKSFFSFNGKSGQRRIKFIAAFALVIFMFTALFYGIDQSGPFVQPVFAGEIKIAALKEDVSGIETDTAFLLTSENALDKKTVEENLQVSPSFNYRLEKEAGGKQYKIIPQEPLDANTVYQLELDPSGQGRESFSWAFQTKGQFRVLRSLPGKNSSGVPVNSGIEITFSHENFSAEEAAKYFTISPEVKGKFEKHKKTLVFVPDSALQNGQIYTATLKKGFPLSESDQAITEDYQFSFETQFPQVENNSFRFDIYDNQSEFATTDTPFFPLYYYWEGPVPKAKVEVFRYPDTQTFINSQAKLNEIPSWAYHTRNSYREDFNLLKKFEEFEIDVIDTDRYSHYLVFPKELPAGLYTARITMDKEMQQVWFQVSDLAVYLAQGRGASLFWVNSVGTGQPVGGAKISVAGLNKDWTTDQKGAAFIKEGLVDQADGFAIVQKDEQITVVDLLSNFTPEEEYNLNGDYWKYLYVDREIYQPGDTVNFWGILSPRQGAKEKINEITLELRGGAYRPYYSIDDDPILEQKIKVDKQTFFGEMQLPVLRPGYYYIQVKSGNTVLTSNGFSVETYTKPAYELTVEAEKKAIFAGEKMNFKVQAAFFEGTPVPKMKLNYYIDGESGSVVTDEQGIATIPYVGKTNNEFNNSSYVHLYVTTSLPEAGEISTNSMVYVFSSRVNLESQVERKDAAYTLQMETQKVDLTKLNQGEYLGQNNYLAGPAPNMAIKGRLVKEIWTKIETGQYYDFINKKVEKTYEYRYSTQDMGEFETTTGSDGKITYQGQLDDPEASYYIDLSVVDSSGGICKSRVYLHSRTINSDPGYYYYFLKNERTTGYNVGETAQLTFMQNELEVAPRTDGFLYYQAQKELNSYSVGNDANYSFTFTKEMNPNTTVTGVYFDGKKYEETSRQVVAINYESKKLNVTITSDQEEYRPGDKVKLAVQANDSAGKPVQAEVNLNLVDEALFSLAEQYVNLAGSLYSDYIFPQLFTQNTHHNEMSFGGGAEKGGEGGGERSDFRDTVLFTTVQTGRDGKATTEFTLPDNLTSWRVTYHALTEDLFVASGTKQIPVRLPFFVDVTMNEVYHAGDQPVLLLRSYGNKLTEGQKVSYQTILKTPKGQEIKGSGQGISFTPFDWQMPVLEEGEYTLTVSGKWASYEDTISQKMTVKKPLLERTITGSQLLTNDLKLQGSATYPTKVIFTDYEKSQYLRGLYALAWTSGSRIEQQLAAREARKLLQQYFPAEDYAYSPWQEEESFIKYQQDDGGIGILPYSESELALSAIVASTITEDFDTRALAGYFYSILEGEEVKEDDKTLALWGLASLKEPVLLQTKAELEREDLAPAEKISLAMALLELGDGSYGKTVFQEILKQHGEDLGNTIRMKVTDHKDNVISATTQMALLAARLDAPEKGKLYQYILENPGEEILNNIEKLQILRYGLKYMQSEPVSFTYQLNGKTEKVSLKDLESHRLTLLPEELAGIKFSQVNGKVGVTTVYREPIPNDQSSRVKGLSVVRTYVGYGNKQYFQRGDLVKVNLNYSIGADVPSGSYEIVDVLPAGLAYIPYPHRMNIKDRNIAYPSEVNGQQLTFYAWEKSGIISYYARVLTPGEYESGSLYLGNVKNPDIFITVGTNKVIIK